MIIGNTQFDFFRVRSDKGRPKKKIPHTQADAKVNSIVKPRRPLPGVMPCVHLRIIKEVFQRAKSEIDVGMIEVADA